MKKTILSLVMLASLSAHAQLMDMNIIDGLTRERMASPYFEKWNLKLKQAVQFQVAADLAMGTVKSAVNHDYYFHRTAQCDVVGQRIERPVVIKKSTRYALVDYILQKGDVISILLYAVDDSVKPGALSIECRGINQNSKVKDLQLLLQKVFVLEPGKKGFFGLF